MLKPLLVILSVLVLGGLAGGCSKCDIFKNDHRSAAQACK